MPTLPARIRQSARISGHFVLRSGQTSDTYFDKYQFESDPQLLRALAGLEMGGIPIMTLLSQVTNIPAAFIRKEPKDYGTCRYAEGAFLQGKRFILVEDVVSSGGAEALRAAGLTLKALFSFEEVERG